MSNPKNKNIELGTKLHRMIERKTIEAASRPVDYKSMVKRYQKDMLDGAVSKTLQQMLYGKEVES